MGAVRTARRPKHDPLIDLGPRRSAEYDSGVKLTPQHYADRKISEGCNHRCSFCIIPSMRGNLVSRPVDDVLREAERLVRGGVRELLVISQDTSAYGIDVRYAEREWRGKAYQTRMKALCEGLAALGVWDRLHYVYPYPHVDDIIRSEEHTSELQSLMRISYAVFCLKKKKTHNNKHTNYSTDITNNQRT